MNPDDVPLPDAGEIASHAIAFARMMFAHTAFEREVYALQDAITGKAGFGEQPQNQVGARRRSKVIEKLIVKHLGKEVPQTGPIKTLLNDAVAACEQRNLLAHGTWWYFNRRTSSIHVRSGTRWVNPKTPPEQREFTASDIETLAEKLKNAQTELYKLRQQLEQQPTKAEVAAALAETCGEVSPLVIFTRT